MTITYRSAGVDIDAGQRTVDQQTGQDQDDKDCENQLDNMHAFLYKYRCYKSPV